MRGWHQRLSGVEVEELVEEPERSVAFRPVLQAAALTVMACFSLALIVYPWLRPQPLDLPPVIEQSTPAHGRLVQAAAAVDAVCATGDVRGLRAAVTDAQWREIGTWMRDAGRQLDAGTLREQGYLIGDLEAMPLIHGASEGDAAVAVFSRRGLGRARVRDDLFAVKFGWDGHDLRFDGKQTLQLGPLDDRELRARAWARDLLAEALTEPSRP